MLNEEPPFTEKLALKLISLPWHIRFCLVKIAGAIRAVLNKDKLKKSEHLSQEFVADFLSAIQKIGTIEFFKPLNLTAKSGRAMCEFLDKIAVGRMVLDTRQVLDHDAANVGSSTGKVGNVYLLDKYKDISDDGTKTSMTSAWNINSLDIVMLHIDSSVDLSHDLGLWMFFTDAPIEDIDDVRALGSIYLEEIDEGDFKREVWVSSDGKIVRVTDSYRIFGQIYQTQMNYHLMPVHIESSGTGLKKYVYVADSTQDRTRSTPERARESELMFGAIPDPVTGR